LLAFVAAERREFDGFLKNAERVVKLRWPLPFARMVWLNGTAAVLVANGPGPKLAGQAADVLREHEETKVLVSTGFCGALDPALKLCDIFAATEVLNIGPALPPDTRHPHKSGKLLSIDCVASTAAEKSELRQTGAGAVEMEAAAVAAKAIEWDVPFYAIRVVTDTADENFVLDFNRMRDTSGRFSRAKIMIAALRRPITVLPELAKLNRRCKDAAQALGDFVAGTRF